METTIANWTEAFDELVEGISPRFVRSEARARARAYLQGLLSHISRKNGWQLAELLGESTPYGVQQFLYRAKWEADEVRDDLQAYVIKYLSDRNGVLVVDESGFLKKGDHSVGVAAQYCGPVGRVANCQVGVFLTYATPQGHTFLDRALYLPESWSQERERCRAAGVPDGVDFATKPALAQQMLERTLAAGVPARWVTADSVYGGHYPLKHWLESVPIGYVLALSPKDTVLDTRGMPQRVSQLLNHLPTKGWQRLSAGQGSKGERWYDWLRLPLYEPERAGFQRWLLVRRSLSDPGDLTPYVCFGPAETPLKELVRVAGTRWRVEQCFEGAKQEVGLDEYEVRSWQGWYRHITLACLAHAFLTVLRTHGLDPLVDEGQKKSSINQSSSLAAFKARRELTSP
jgi:SRSO17 transposase